jgi:hypothetical protein
VNFDEVLRLAREERLYPAVILYGANEAARQEAALRLARVLLCDKEGAERGCDLDANPCNNCRRIVWPAGDASFHPDFAVLQRDLRTATSTEATKTFLQAAYSAPFEARGQVFAIAEAETLGGGAADSLLKLLEEPPSRSPRHFLLLAASRLDLPITLRSRSLSVFLAAGDALDAQGIEELKNALAPALDSFLAAGSAIDLLSAADLLLGKGGFEDPRARRPWAMAAAALVAYGRERQLPLAFRRAILALAGELLDAPRWRVRGIGAGRLLEGYLSRYLPPALKGLSR